MTGSITILYDIIQGVLIESWNIFLEAAPYLIFGFGIAGLLHVLVPDEMVMKYLGKSAGRIRPVINASLLGVPLPLCSCGVIPAAISLKQRGGKQRSNFVLPDLDTSNRSGFHCHNLCAP